MTITYPAWWAGGFPDAEKLLRALFTPLLGGVTVGSWLPATDAYEAQLAAGGGFLRLYRTGGRINRDQNRDEPRIQIAALTRSRDDSWELIEFCRQVLDGYAAGGIVPATSHKLVCTGEVVGPQLLPELIVDDRLVPITVELLTWRPKGLPDYRTALHPGL